MYWYSLHHTEWLYQTSRKFPSPVSPRCFPSMMNSIRDHRHPLPYIQYRNIKLTGRNGGGEGAIAMSPELTHRLSGLSRDVLHAVFEFVAPMRDMSAFLDITPPVARIIFRQLLIAYFVPAAMDDAATNGDLWTFSQNRGLPLSAFAKRYITNISKFKPNYVINIQRCGTLAGKPLQFYISGIHATRVEAYPCQITRDIDETIVYLKSATPIIHSIDYLAANFAIEFIYNNLRVFNVSGEIYTTL